MAQYQLHACIRPDSNGNWYIQSDVDHCAYGITGIYQTSDMLVISFDRNYAKAGSIQVTTDDDFAGSISAHSGLGTSNAGISLKAYPNIKATDPKINPSQIWNYVPNNGGGNLWISVSMSD